MDVANRDMAVLTDTAKESKRSALFTWVNARRLAGVGAAATITALVTLQLRTDDRTEELEDQLESGERVHLGLSDEEIQDLVARLSAAEVAEAMARAGYDTTEDDVIEAAQQETFVDFVGRQVRTFFEWLGLA